MNDRNDHVIMILPPFSAFAVFNARRTVFVRQQREYLCYVFNRSVTFIGICLTLRLFYFIFCVK